MPAKVLVNDNTESFLACNSFQFHIPTCKEGSALKLLNLGAEPIVMKHTFHQLTWWSAIYYELNGIYKTST